MSIINPLNPLQQVRLSCDKVFEVASFCKICDEGIEKFAESVLQEGTDKFRQGKMSSHSLRCFLSINYCN